ncbi:MAG: hypothetical protein AB1847_20500 [bacterium]
MIGICLSQGRSSLLREVANICEEQQITRVELLDIISTVLISRGPVALITALEAGILSDKQDGNKLPFVNNDTKMTGVDILCYFRKNMGSVPDWIRLLDETIPRGVELYYNWRNKILTDGTLSRKIKELTLFAVNAVSLYREGMKIHAMGFIQAGGSRKELFIGLLIAFIGGGIVAWIEGIGVMV